MYWNSRRVIFIVKEIVNSDNLLKQWTGYHLSYSVTRKLALQIFGMQVIIPILLILGDIHYYTKVKAPTLWLTFYSISYQMFYFSSACIFAILYFFLLLLRIRFQFINRQIFLLHTSQCKIIYIINSHRDLRTISQHVNTAFRAQILGRVVVICMDLTYVIFGTIAVSDNGYLKFTTLVWCYGHSFEVMLIIFCFWALSKEVSMSLLKQLVLPLTMLEHESH